MHYQSHAIMHPEAMATATVNATAAEIELEKATIAAARHKATEVAHESHRAMVSLTTARRAVALGQQRNTLAFEAMEASLRGVRAAKIQRTKTVRAAR
jgi:hypothetical protein